MSTPAIFLHYWTPSNVYLSFQEIMEMDIHPDIVAIMQSEIHGQLCSEMMQSELPCFDWTTMRMQEKWNASMANLLMQVQLPKEIWETWIQELNGVSIDQTDHIPTFADLLTAEVYYANPAGELEEMPDEDPQVIDNYFDVTDELPDVDAFTINNDNTSPEDSSLSPETQSLESEAYTLTPEVQSLESEAYTLTPDAQSLESEASSLTPEAQSLESEALPTTKLIDFLAETKEEKVFDTIQMQDISLKNRVETQMTDSLAEIIPLFQQLNFIQELVQGDQIAFKELIDFIDTHATPLTWKSQIDTTFGHHQTANNQETWDEFYVLVDRKFN